MTNGADGHGRSGKKKAEERKAKSKGLKASLKRKNLIPPGLTGEKSR